MKFLNDTVNEISETIGAENALKLVRRFSGEQLYIPTYERTVLEYRNELIREDYFKKGFTYKQLSIRYKLKRRQLHNIISLKPPKKKVEEENE